MQTRTRRLDDRPRDVPKDREDDRQHDRQNDRPQNQTRPVQQQLLPEQAGARAPAGRRPSTQTAEERRMHAIRDRKTTEAATAQRTGTGSGPRGTGQPDQRARQQGDRGPLRIQKVQYRFLMELKERTLKTDEVDGAFLMASKIRRYPVQEEHVLSSWERFTAKAIEDYKANIGSNAERDTQHRAYALLFAAVGQRPVTDIADLVERIKRRVDDNHSERTDNDVRDSDGREQPNKQPAPEVRNPRVDARAGGHTRHAPAERTVPGAPVALPDRRPDERRDAAPPDAVTRTTAATRALPEHTFGPERSGLDVRVDKMLGTLRELPSDMRATVEAHARTTLERGEATPKSAREDLPEALFELKVHKSADNTVRALALAAIARFPERAELVAQAERVPKSERADLAREANHRAQEYENILDGMALLDRDVRAATLRRVLKPTPQNERTAVVLAQAYAILVDREAKKDEAWSNRGADDSASARANVNARVNAREPADAFKQLGHQLDRELVTGPV